MMSLAMTLLVWQKSAQIAKTKLIIVFSTADVEIVLGGSYF